MSKYVYFFGGGKADGSTDMKALLGGKGANLAEMTNIGLPVPAGFTLTTEVCTYFYKNGRKFPPELRDQTAEALQRVEKLMGAKFGDATNPLLLSCRSGARESMPGMMDTVLNIGLNDTTVKALVKQSGNERFALDSYRRLLLMYGEVVMGLKGHHDEPFDHILSEVKKAKGVKLDNELDVDALTTVIARYKEAIKKYTGKDFPENPMDQVWNAVGAVFGSWMSDRAMVYRRQYGIPDEWGTACSVMAMVFGNLGDDCATGVALTRDGALGTPGMCGDYLINAQGEDVVNGSRPTKRIEETLGKDMPEAYRELVAVGHKLEKHYRNMQDIEFTIQRNKLYMLQTRNAKRTGFAAVRVAVDMVEEGLITKDEAISPKYIPAGDLSQLLQPLFDAEAKKAASKSGKLLDQGHPGRPRRRHRQDRVHAAKGRGAQAGRPEGGADPGAQGDDAGRPARHEGGARHPHGRRRRVVARGPGEPADGQGVHRRRRRAGHQRLGRHAVGRGQGVEGRRRHQHRRLHRRGVRRPHRHQAQRGGAGADQERTRPRKGGDVPPLPEGDGLGGGPPQAGRADQRRPAGPGGGGHRLRGGGHRPVPHRAHVLRPHLRDA